MSVKKMSSVDRLLGVARGELGTKESPANSNKVKYGAWYGLNGYAWCVMFVQWVFDKCGVALPIKTASCTQLMNAAKADGVWVTSCYKPGDVVIYDWGRDYVPDHCGIVESVNGSQVIAIEGNTSIGNDSDGGEVMRRTRSTSKILGAVRPTFNDCVITDNDPAEAHKDGVEWAIGMGILQGDEYGNLKLSQPVTRQQLCTILYRFFKEINRG